MITWDLVWTRVRGRPVTSLGLGPTHELLDAAQRLAVLTHATGLTLAWKASQPGRVTIQFEYDGPAGQESSERDWYGKLPTRDWY